jgi:hypothetical protein
VSAEESLQLLRIEHKLDLILHALKDKDIALQFLPGLNTYHTDSCPVCQRPIHLTIDPVNEVYIRRCHCEPHARLVTGISSVGQPIQDPKTHRAEPDVEDSDEQDPT